jgi:hypothetical protein
MSFGFNLALATDRSVGTDHTTAASAALVTPATQRRSTNVDQPAQGNERHNTSMQVQPRQAVQLDAFREWLILDAETGPAAWLRDAVTMAFPSCVPKVQVIASEALQRLKNIHIHIDREGQNLNEPWGLQVALRCIATDQKTLKALINLVNSDNPTEAARTLANSEKCRFLFDALQGFIYSKRSPEKQQLMESRLSKVNSHLATIGIEASADGPTGRAAAITELELTQKQVNTTGSWFAPGGIGLQAMTLLNAIKVSYQPQTFGKNSYERKQAKRFKPGPQAITALFTNPAEVTQWLPPDASIQQIVKELLRRANDQFEPKPTAAPFIP